MKLTSGKVMQTLTVRWVACIKVCASKIIDEELKTKKRYSSSRPTQLDLTYRAVALCVVTASKKSEE